MEAPQSPITPQAAAAELLRRRHARAGLLAFTQYTKSDYNPHWHHEAIASKLDDVLAGKIRRLMIFTAPQHGKSELVSRRFSAYILGRNPNFNLLGCSCTSDLAIAMNRDVQKIIETDEYRRLFPGTFLNGKWVRGSARYGSRRTLDYFEPVGYNGSLRSAGVQVTIAGKRADGTIIDDPFGSREDAESPAIRQRVWEWYATDLHTRLATNAWIVLTHTRWHRDDLAGRLLIKMADKSGVQWDILNLPAIRTETLTYPGDPRQPGEPLWPAFKSLKDLEEIRQQDTHSFEALYQQSPETAGASEWSPEYFGRSVWCDEANWPKPEEFDVKAIGVDPSKGKQDRQHDYSAIVFVGRKNGTLYVDADLERRNPHKIVRDVIRMADKYHPDAIGFETDQFQELIADEFETQQPNYAVMWNVLKMPTGNVKKEVRIRRLSSAVVRRQFQFRDASPGCHILVDQMMDFPTAEHDDGPDAAEQAVRVMAYLLGVADSGES